MRAESIETDYSPMLRKLKRNTQLLIEQLRFHAQMGRNRRAILAAYAQPRSTRARKPLLSVMLGIGVATVLGGMMLWGGRALHTAIALQSPRPVVPPDIPVPADIDPPADADQPAVHHDAAEQGDTFDPLPDTLTAPEGLWLPPHLPEHALVVNKGTGTMYLLSLKDRIPTVERDFAVTTGSRPGPKKVEGDRKTPEGLYFIVGRREARELDVMYGPLAYILNYPNRNDLKAGRTGHGIWIHGSAPDSAPTGTRGCVEMKNEELTALAGVLGFGYGTPVVIIDKDTVLSVAAHLDLHRMAQERAIVRTTYRDQAAALNAFTSRWARLWESRSMERFRTVYDTAAFASPGQNWAQWSSAKQGTFELYSTISVSFRNLLVTEYYDTAAVVKFVQYYTSDINRFVNSKRLALRNRDNQWFIYSESTFPQEEMPL